MEKYAIIDQLETYALSQGWAFVYGVDEFDNNLESVRQYDPGQCVLIADFAAEPTILNSKTQSITYTCILMLGRKFDADGQAATMDETPKQKYDRRIKELMVLLATAIGAVGCGNNLDVLPGQLVVGVNVYDENIDFAVGNNVVFTDESPDQT